MYQNGAKNRLIVSSVIVITFCWSKVILLNGGHCIVKYSYHLGLIHTRYKALQSTNKVKTYCCSLAVNKMKMNYKKVFMCKG